MLTSEVRAQLPAIVIPSLMHPPCEANINSPDPASGFALLNV
jgi:hypothetical protein